MISDDSLLTFGRKNREPRILTQDKITLGKAQTPGFAFIRAVRLALLMMLSQSIGARLSLAQVLKRTGAGKASLTAREVAEPSELKSNTNVRVPTSLLTPFMPRSRIRPCFAPDFF
ncbi:MAG TPA: hypothetical protein VJS64_16315 [Pyrinomonadaceae bacterium]|nr:hypothetical protein [Pyrinomonadaceae bacterium]